jgi:hypothetical protein
MYVIGEYLIAYLTADNIALALVLVGTCLFSILAARAEARLWRKTRHIGCRRRQQQFITEGKAHLR